jgi:hypothetical protein
MITNFIVGLLFLFGLVAVSLAEVFGFAEPST